MTEILANKQYTLYDFNEIKKSLNFSNSLEPDVINIINEIALKVGAPTYQKTPIFKKRSKKRKNDISHMIGCKLEILKKPN